MVLNFAVQHDGARARAGIFFLAAPNTRGNTRNGSKARFDKDGLLHKMTTKQYRCIAIRYTQYQGG